MCDCYWQKCECCETHLPVHISDFCMEREGISVFCASHLPANDIVIYELIDDKKISEKWEPEEHFAGWKMGVRYLVAPPAHYGLTAVEPNIGAEYLAEYIDKNRRKSYFTSHTEIPFSSKDLAVKDVLVWYQKRIEESKDKKNKEELLQKLVPYYKKEKKLWERVMAQEQTKKNVKKIFDSLEPVKKLKKQDRLISGILIGSLANREYVPGLSDIDFLIIGKNLKRALKTEFFKSKGFETDINIVCRSPNSFEKSLSKGNPVDLIAFKYGEVIYDKGYFKKSKKNKDAKPTAKTIQSWLQTGLHHFGELLYQYFSPCCAHCFFSAAYHSSRELLRALLLGKGKDVLEGWELKLALEKNYPELFPLFLKICQARKEWDKYSFPLFNRCSRITGRLGKIVLLVEKIVREALKTQGLNVPPLNNLLKEIKDVKDVHSLHISLPEKEVMVLFQDKQEKMKSYKVKLDM